jgi:hypothetical protein
MDPSIPVVAILLDNPKMVELDVVRIAARRPNLPEILNLIAAHAKWSNRYNVQLALAQNPYATTALAAAMTPFLSVNHMLSLVQDGALHSAVRETAKTVQQWRKEGRSCSV